MRSRILIARPCLALLAAVALPAQNPALVHDINQTGAPSWPGPANANVDGGGWMENQSFSQINGWNYFVATDALGAELWRTQATAATAQRVADINPAGDSNPSGLVAVGGNMFLCADDGTTGPELWATNGTAAGTRLVCDIEPGIHGSAPFHLVAIGGTRVVFRATTSTYGNEVWVSDGTAANTMLLRDIFPGPDHSWSYNFAADAAGNTVYFRADDGVHGSELWATDGTPNGTRLVKDIVPGANGSFPTGMIPLGNKVLFEASGQLWETDGTAAGTLQVYNFLRVCNFYYGRAVLNGKLYFAGNDGGTGSELWETDGTTAGTRLVKDTLPGRDGTQFRHPHVWNGRIWFVGSAGTWWDNYELYVTDGTAAGTTLVKDLVPGVHGSWPRYLRGAGNRLLFAARASGARVYNDDEFELWATDGTAAGTARAADIWPGVPGCNPRYLTAINNRVLFAADDGSHGDELWESDGTTAGTRLFLDLFDGGATGHAGPTHGCQLGDFTLFAAHDGAHGVELWRTDGTAAGTSLVRDIQPGVRSSSPADLAQVGGHVVFAADDGVNGRELWVTDGTTAGTWLLRDIYPGSPGNWGNPQSMKNIDGLVYFHAWEGSSGAIWRTDGTVSGTRGYHPMDYASGFTELPGSGGRFVFQGCRSPFGCELWISGGGAGTQMVLDISISNFSSYPAEFTPLGDGLLFSAWTQNAGQELWYTDGTSAGTRMVADIVPGAASSGPGHFAEIDGDVLFHAATPTEGDELWTTDGTTAGTALVKDIYPGAGSSYAAYLTPAGYRRVLFRATDGSNAGPELWETDGTAAGTRLVADLHPLGGSWMNFTTEGRRPRFHRVRNRFYFRANEPVHGWELWEYDAGGMAWSTGHGCSATGAPPHLIAQNPRLGTTQQVFSRQLAISSVGILVLGFPDATPGTLRAGCPIYVDLSAPAVLTIDLWAQIVGDQHTTNVAVPNAPALAGLYLAMQALVLPPGFATLNDASLSNGVFEVLGN